MRMGGRGRFIERGEGSDDCSRVRGEYPDEQMVNAILPDHRGQSESSSNRRSLSKTCAADYLSDVVFSFTFERTQYRTFTSLAIKVDRVNVMTRHGPCREAEENSVGIRS